MIPNLYRSDTIPDEEFIGTKAEKEEALRKMNAERMESLRERVADALVGVGVRSDLLPGSQQERFAQADAALAALGLDDLDAFAHRVAFEVWGPQVPDIEVQAVIDGVKAALTATEATGEGDDLAASLREADEDLKAGRTVSLAELRAELDATEPTGGQDA